MGFGLLASVTPFLTRILQTGVPTLALNNSAVNTRNAAWTLHRPFTVHTCPKHRSSTLAKRFNDGHGGFFAHHGFVADLEDRMRSLQTLHGISLVAVSLALAAPVAIAQQPTPASWLAVENALGRKGAMQPGNIIKFSFPRSDLTVSVGGIALKPALALGGWVAFKATAGGQAMAMGDLVLTEDEVSPVMRALQAGGVEQTALHNHVLKESPRVMYMHILGQGDPATIARVIHDALGQSKTPLGPASPPAAASAADLDTTAIARALGVAGKLNGVVYQVTVPRSETITEMGTEVPASMGVATAINFQPTGGGKAAITGDFVLRGSEVNPVIRALRENGIEVTAVHSHMLTEEPRLFFMHFWADDDAVKLARGLRAALDRTASKK
jgi:hypothetical protein